MSKVVYLNPMGVLLTLTNTAKRPSNSDAFVSISACVEDVYHWFLGNGMLLKPAKTDAVVFGTCARWLKLGRRLV
jgi:hypothetical protein